MAGYSVSIHFPVALSCLRACVGQSHTVNVLAITSYRQAYRRPPPPIYFTLVHNQQFSSMCPRQGAFNIFHILHYLFCPLAPEPTLNIGHPVSFQSCFEGRKFSAKKTTTGFRWIRTSSFSSMIRSSDQTEFLFIPGQTWRYIVYKKKKEKNGEQTKH